MTFCQVYGIDALDLWSGDCIQFSMDLLQWHVSTDWCRNFQLSLIAALYIDSTKQAAHVRSTFATLLKYTTITTITDIQLYFPGAYDHGKLAVYWYMAVSQKPIDQDGYPLAALYYVIANTIAEHSTLRLSGLHILDIAVRHAHKIASPLDWFKRTLFCIIITVLGEPLGFPLEDADHWVLLHLETLLAPQVYLSPEEVKELTWSDTPEKVHIAMARLVLYDSLAKPEHEGAEGFKPDPELLRVFLWSNDYGVCTQAFKWFLDLVPIGHSRTKMFIPDTMGYEWVEHIIYVLCKSHRIDGCSSWQFLLSHLVPKWSMLPSSWCCDFASAFLFSIVHPLDMHGLPAYQYLAQANRLMTFDEPEPQAFLPFLASVLELIKSSLNWVRLTSLESWLANPQGSIENRDARTQMEHILATRKQQLVEETFAELPMAGSWTDE
jgi:hypothetical protein